MQNIHNYREYLYEKKFVGILSPEDEYFFRKFSNKISLSRNSQIKLVDKIKENCKLNEKKYQLEKTNDETEMDYLQDYVSFKGDYKLINNQLRDNNIEIKYNNIINKIDDIILRYKLKNDIIVYRGCNYKSLMDDKSFKSCSLSSFIANNFVHDDNSKLYRFLIPKGTNYAYIGGTEFEILFKRDLILNNFVKNDVFEK